MKEWLENPNSRIYEDEENREKYAQENALKKIHDLENQIER